MTNEPKVSITREVLKNLPYSIKVANSFSNADKHSQIRQLYEISYLAEKNTTNIITPKWIKIKAKAEKILDAEDFRDELKIIHNKKLIFDISVASIEKNSKKEWHKIGTITLDESIISKGCDHKLHFHHPIFKDNLKYL
jgi:hypothetical protein